MARFKSLVADRRKTGRQPVLASRLEILKFAADQIAKQKNSAAAVAEAVEATAGLPRADARTQRCLRKESEIYYGKSMNSAAAMAKAFAACGDN